MNTSTTDMIAIGVRTMMRALTRRNIVTAAVCGTAIALIGCTDVTPPLPAGTQDPSVIKTVDGARALANGSIRLAPKFAQYAFQSGVFTDELMAFGSNEALELTTDLRNPDNTNGSTLGQVYLGLHNVRTSAALASTAMAAYAPHDSSVARAELYALEGYAEVLLAEGYCSGIPLSHIDLDGDFTYTPGLTTVELFTHAAALFDTAMTLSGDSARVTNLARVGKGRALLGLSSYAGAAHAVVDVPDYYTYTVALPTTASTTLSYFLSSGFSVSDREGRNGLPFLSSADPRSAVDSLPLFIRNFAISSPILDTLYAPAKYALVNGTIQMPIASGIEARLIEAEAAAHGITVPGGNAVAVLNQLRNTYYPGVLPALPTLLSGNALIDTLFAERGEWLFLTGHRLGDFRRLVRAYDRTPESVYPTGLYLENVLEVGKRYGGSVRLPAVDERDMNPYYTGCLNEEA